MEVKAKAKNIRISPTKAKLVIDIIRGKNAIQALSELEFINKKASQPVLKLLKSAIANAKNNYSLDDKNLYISKIQADNGSIYKRIRFRARGRRDIISKRTTHITIVLSESEEKVKEGTKLTQQFIQEEIKKEEDQKKAATTLKEKKQVKTPSSAPAPVGATADKKALKDDQKPHKEVKEEKIEVISKKKEKFFKREKKPKVKKKESFFKKFFRRKSV